MESKKNCRVCGSCDKKLMKCGKCQSAIYCGIGCQKEDWVVHKLLCGKKPIELLGMAKLVHDMMLQGKYMPAIETSHLSSRIIDDTGNPYEGDIRKLYSNLTDQEFYNFYHTGKCGVNDVFGVAMQDFLKDHPIKISSPHMVINLIEQGEYVVQKIWKIGVKITTEYIENIFVYENTIPKDDNYESWDKDCIHKPYHSIIGLQVINIKTRRTTVFTLDLTPCQYELKCIKTPFPIWMEEVDLPNYILEYKELLIASNGKQFEKKEIAYAKMSFGDVGMKHEPEYVTGFNKENDRVYKTFFKKLTTRLQKRFVDPNRR